MIKLFFEIWQKFAYLNKKIDTTRSALEWFKISIPPSYHAYSKVGLIQVADLGLRPRKA